MLKNDLEPEQLKKANLKEIKAHTKINFGKNSIFPISVTHSIPDAVCFVLYTPDGAIVYTGDFVFDATMQGAYKTDIGKLAYVGKQGVLCLMAESFYAEKEGHTSPSNRVAGFIREVLAKNPNRIIATIFPAHFYRIQEMFNEVSKTHRKIVIMGKGLQDMINKAVDEGYLSVDKSRIGTLSDLENKDTVILISDEKEKPFNNLDRIIKGYDKYIKIKETDTIFITEPAYPGIEKRSALIMDEIAMLGANAVSLSSKKHLLHHASREDLMLMINLMNPKYYFPVKGEYRNQYANAEVAEQIGIPRENIILKENGDVAEFIKGKLTESKEHIEVDQILIDGKSQGDIGDLVLKDRDMASGKMTSLKDRELYLENNPKNHRVLKRFEIENYLYDKEVLEAYCLGNNLEFNLEKYNSIVKDINNDNLKDQTSAIKSCCNIKGSLNPEVFKRNLASYITKDMNVYKELEEVIFDNN